MGEEEKQKEDAFKIIKAMLNIIEKKYDVTIKANIIKKQNAS